MDLYTHYASSGGTGKFINFDNIKIYEIL
jgi:hypothetical protein